MTREEIIEAILRDDDQMMPYLQDWQARDIVDFVLENYLPKWKQITTVTNFNELENSIDMREVILCSDEEGYVYYISRRDLMNKLPKEKRETKG